MYKQTSDKKRTLLTMNALLFSIFTLTLSTTLLILDFIGEGIWLSSLPIFLTGSSIIYFSEVILSFDLKGLKVTLANINKKEESIKDLAIVTLEIAKISEKLNFQPATPEYEELKQKLLIATEKLDNLTKESHN